MKSGIVKLLAGVSLVAVSALGVVPAGAAPSPGVITGGNDATVNAPELDGWTNLAIVDTSNPISGTGFLTQWSFFPGRTGNVELLVVRPSTTGTDPQSATNQIIYVSPEVTVSSTQVEGKLPVVESLLTPAWVQQGDLVGLYFVENAGVIPFTGCNCVGSSGSVYYTAPSFGSPTSVAVGQTLTYGDGRTSPETGGAVTRAYSFSVSGYASGAFCKDGGWESAGIFANQGACVSFFATQNAVPIGSANSSWN